MPAWGSDGTSFVAVSEVVRNPGAPASYVKQPLALPAGVSNSAVGESIEGADEPELWLIALIAMLVAAGLRIRSRREEALVA